jgi:hypothetical protein
LIMSFLLLAGLGKIEERNGSEAKNKSTRSQIYERVLLFLALV